MQLVIIGKTWLNSPFSSSWITIDKYNGACHLVTISGATSLAHSHPFQVTATHLEIWAPIQYKDVILPV